jgi:hypothetical protein
MSEASSSSSIALQSAVNRSLIALQCMFFVSACGPAPIGAPDLGQDDGGAPPVRSCATELTFKGAAHTVAVGGEWNKFDPTMTPMHGPDNAGAWHASITLAPGAYGYKLVVDGNWILDPANPYTKFVDAVENSLVEVDDCATPRLDFVSLSKSADGAVHAIARYVDGAGAAGLDPAALTVLLDGAATGATADASGLIDVAAAGLAKDKHRLTFRAADRALNASFLGPTELHAHFDFPLYWNELGALGTFSESLRSLEAAAAASDAAYGGAAMSPFFGNHDVPRFISQAANMLDPDPQAQAWADPPPSPSTEEPYQRLRLALTFQFTQPGVPLLYYGDEYGQPGAADPDNRRFMKWTGMSAFEQATIDQARKLGAARAELLALQRGNRTTLWIDDDFYVYARVAGPEVAIVAINRAASARAQLVPIPATVPISDGAQLRDRLGGAAATAGGGQLSLSLPALGSAVYAP